MQQEPQSERAIQTERLVLRPPAPADAEAITALADNFAVSGHLARVPYPYVLANAQNWIDGLEEAWNAGAGDFVACLHDGTLIGVCSYGVEEHPSAGRLGYWYGEPFWGKGYATEAAQAVIRHAFARHRQSTEMNAEHHVENAASAHVLVKCGFRAAGRRQGWFQARQEYVALTEMKLERKNWAAR